MSSLFANLSHITQSRDPALNQRRADRDLVDMVSHVTARGPTHGIRIINISPLGLMCRTEAALLIGERVNVWLPIVKEIGAAVRWAGDGRAGLEFLPPVEARTYARILELIPPRRIAW